MIEPVWLNVLQRIPTDSHDSISIVTTTGAELVVLQMFRFERDFMVIRARTSGTMDTGRTIIVAYSQIDFLAFNKKMTEEEVGVMFAEPMPEFAPPPMAMAYQPAPFTQPIPLAATTSSRPLPAPSPAPQPAASVDLPPAAEAASGASKPGQISKTILLARLRERLAEKSR